MATSARLIKKRIKSSQNIAQITKAMEMVAASKVKKAQNEAIQGRPYADRVYRTVGNLSGRIDIEVHPLLRTPEEIEDLKFLIILITTNKGLCGSLNTALLLALNSWMKTQKENGVAQTFDFITLGKKGQKFVAQKGTQYIADFSDTVPFINNISPLAKMVMEKFLDQEYDMIWIAYNEFISALKQEPKIKRILPISRETDPEIFKEKKKEEEKEKTKGEKEGPAYIVIEPSPEAVLESILPFYIQIQIKNAILEAEASEHSARMLAMRNATDNANALIDGLTLEYNKARQQTITYEISDIETARASITPKE